MSHDYLTAVKGECMYYFKDFYTKQNFILSVSYLMAIKRYSGGARGVMVIIVGNGHGDTSSNPGRDRLH